MEPPFSKGLRQKGVMPIQEDKQEETQKPMNWPHSAFTTYLRKLPFHDGFEVVHHHCVALSFFSPPPPLEI